MDKRKQSIVEKNINLVFVFGALSVTPPALQSPAGDVIMRGQDRRQESDD